jgi:hypothetical protein
MLQQQAVNYYLTLDLSLLYRIDLCLFQKYTAITSKISHTGEEAQCTQEIHVIYFIYIHVLISFQRVTCSENYDSKYCVPDSKYLYINFDRISGKSASGAGFRLHVTARKVFDCKLS